MDEVNVESDFDVPVFAPSLNEFMNFKAYVTNLERFYGHFGIVKVSTLVFPCIVCKWALTDGLLPISVTVKALQRK